MNDIDRAVAQWLKSRWGDYEIHGEPRLGTYGQVWVMEAVEERLFPKRTAKKTINPQKLPADNSNEIVSVFEREMHLWLQIPEHPNVVTALGIDIAELPAWVDGRIRRLPMVRMPYCESSLKEWIDLPFSTVGLVDRLFALCQLSTGLRWLYEHGVEGHGDLKPDNVLVSDLQNRFSLPRENVNAGRWRVQVADLGWANAWIDLGYSNRAWRPYLAPERLDDTFVPSASDIFAVGVIGVELFQGRHPAGHSTLQVGNWKEVKYRKWAERGHRDLAGIELPELRSVLEGCLAADASKRPRPEEIVDRLSMILRDRFGFDVSEGLTNSKQRASAPSSLRQAIWVAEELARGGERLFERSVQDLEDQLKLVNEPQSISQIARWFVLAKSIVQLLGQRRLGTDIVRLGQLEKTATDLLKQRLFQVTRLQCQSEWDDTLERDLCISRWFEAFADVICSAKTLLYLTIGPTETESVFSAAGPFCLATYRFCHASDLHGSMCEGSDAATAPIQELDACIELCPVEATLHFFKGLWLRHAMFFLHDAPDGERSRLRDECESSLRKASELDPTWQEPVNHLRNLMETKR